MTRINSPLPIPAWVPIQDTLFREGKIRLRIRAALHVEDPSAHADGVLAHHRRARLRPPARGADEQCRQREMSHAQRIYAIIIAAR